MVSWVIEDKSLFVLTLLADPMHYPGLPLKNFQIGECLTIRSFFVFVKLNLLRSFEGFTIISCFEILLRMPSFFIRDKY